MPKYGMVIDLLKCTGCGACGVGCKTQNNTDDAHNGQTFNWADFCDSMEGKFPNPKYTMYPTLCNHCDDAPCVTACPVAPTAMYKSANGTTLHNEERCIGCAMCQEACPYSSTHMDEDKGAKYSVVSMNGHDVEPFAHYRNPNEMVKGITTSGAEVAKKAGSTPPHRTMHAHPDYNSVRGQGKAEKCIFCDHLVTTGQDPYCTQVCPARARTFGDLEDKNSAASKLLAANRNSAVVMLDNKGTVRKADAKTKANVFYVRSFSARK
jgi:Fe-S-cluster-containing dehydrogenase component